jgi:hypothetical protein
MKNINYYLLGMAISLCITAAQANAKETGSCLFTWTTEIDGGKTRHERQFRWELTNNGAQQPPTLVVYQKLSDQKLSANGTSLGKPLTKEIDMGIPGTPPLQHVTKGMDLNKYIAYFTTDDDKGILVQSISFNVNNLDKNAVKWSLNANSG